MSVFANQLVSHSADPCLTMPGLVANGQVQISLTGGNKQGAPQVLRKIILATVVARAPSKIRGMSSPMKPTRNLTQVVVMYLTEVQISGVQKRAALGQSDAHTKTNHTVKSVKDKGPII